MRLSLRGSPIANNSIVPISDIGDNMDSRILCITCNPDCCRSRSQDSWYFPNGKEVGSRGSGGDIYRSRTTAEPTKPGTVMLGCRDQRPNANGPTGLYSCIIRDRHGVKQTLIVGIYSSHENSELQLHAQIHCINTDNLI